MQAASQRRAEAASAAIPQSKAKQQSTSSAKKQSGSKTQGVHRKVNLGQRASGATGSKRPNEDLVSASSTLNKKMREATPELAINSADQERLAILEQIQDQIFKKGTEVSGSSLSPEEGEEIERLLHGLVSMSHNAAMELMNTNQTRAAGRTLRQCAEFIESKVPRPVAVIVVQKGIMHAVYNNMAQHANMTADMNLSIEYLAKALEAAEQPETQQELLPLAETYLNLANGYSFLTRYDQALKYGEKALRFARLRCNQLRDEIQDERNNSSADAPSQKVESLDYQLNDFIAIKIMAHLCIGEQQEKLGSFNAAIKSYSEGQKFSETNFGIKHPLYTKCVNAMGGAKLKSKYQTKENYRNVENSGNVQKTQENNAKMPPTAARKERKGNKAFLQPADNSIKSKLMARRLQGSDSLPNRAGRRNIQGAMVKATEVRMSNMMRNSKANMLMQNCDQWTSMQSRHPRPQSKQSLIVNMQKQKAKGRLARPSSVQSERRMTREQHSSREILSSTPSDKRAPYKVVCKNGPGCKNHDWHGKSPLQKVDRNSSFRSSRQAKNIRYNTQQQEGADEGMGNTQQCGVTLNDTQQSMHLQSEGPKDLSHRSVMIDETQQIDNKSAGGHSCTVNQNERIHQQQMEQMRTMQEDQFKMLQMVMENSQSKQTAGQLAPYQQMQQQQQNYMQYAAAMGGYYQPPQFYNQGNYGGYSQPMYHQYAGAGAQQQPGYSNWQDQQGYPTDESATETDQMSDAEQIRAGQQPAQSELSKAEMLEQAYSQQQQEMIEMQQRMSQMQLEYNDQVTLIKESNEAFKASKYAKSARAIQTLSQRDYKEDDGGSVNENRDEVTAQKLIMKDVSAQAFDTMKQSSILKQSTIKSRGVNYHDSVMEGKGGNDSSKSPDLRSDISNSFTKASPYRMSVNQSQRSMARSSFVTEKSFRIPGGKHKISKNEAAILIQKNYLRFRHRQDFKMVIKRKIQKKFLFKATIRSGQNTTKLLTCSLNMRGNGGKIESITFIIGDSLRSSSRHNEKIQIDLRSYDIQDTTDMKDKVLQIIKDALAAEEINQRVVEECFQSKDAKEILEADFFTSDDYSAQVQQPGTQNLRPPRAAIASRSSQQVNKQSEEQSAHFKQSNAKERSQDRIAAEIAAIRKRCEVKCVIGIGSVKVKGHKREMDAFDDDTGDDEALTRNFGVDSDEEENTKHIFLSQVNIRKTGKDSGRGEVVFNSDAASSDVDSQHDYQFIIGGKKSSLIKKQPSLATIVKVQALVRGFLARLIQKHQSRSLFNRILKMDDKLIRFMLVKKGSMSYKLSAQVQVGKKLTKSKYLTQLPFKDSDANDKFELSLVFSMTPNEITELDLKSDEVEPANPFLDTNLFIMDYKPKVNSGDHLIKSWKLRDTYPCEFFQVNSTQDTSYFKVVVTHRAKTSYLKLHKLPEDIKYMAYYFNEVLMVSLDATQVLQYIYLVVLPDKPTFKRQMRELEARYFVQKSNSVRPKTAKVLTDKQRYNTVSATSSAAALPVSITSAAALRRQDTMAKATKAREFWIIRDSKEYLVEVFDETQSKGRYQIFVSKKDDPFDKDSVFISQITLFMDEMISYIKENLKIYTRPDGKIDYLSLSNDTTIYNMKNKRRVRESLSQVRVKDNTNPSVRGSSVNSSSIRNSIESHGGMSRMSRIVPQLKDKLSEFKIERNGIVYVVNVQERKNYAERPLQITVTAVDDSRDTRYIVYHNKEQKSDSELISYLQSNLCVYTKQDEMMKRQMIQYVSLTQAQVTYRRSSTMTMGDEQFLVAATKKNMVKARASKPRNSYLETQPPKNMKNFTIDNTTFRREKDLLRDFSPNLDPNWEELTRETVRLDNGKADAILMASTQETISLPAKNNSDVEQYYRIILMHCLDRKILAECDLSPQASNWLFRVRPNFLDRNSSRLTVSELMQLQSQSATYDQSQIDLLKQSSSYEANKTEWAQILQHVRYEGGEVKFDLWSLCQSRAQQKGVSNKLIQSRPKTVSIQSKLNSNRRGLTQTAMVLSSSTEEIKTCNTCDHKIDQGNNLGDTLTELRKDTPSQQSHDQSDHHQSQYQTEEQMVSKRTAMTTSVGQQNINEL